MDRASPVAVDPEQGIDEALTLLRSRLTPAIPLETRVIA